MTDIQPNINQDNIVYEDKYEINLGGETIPNKEITVVGPSSNVVLTTQTSIEEVNTV
jgi:hypothetical protein